jgi:phosphopantothenoylcysteine synthetase/decarboxylase
MPTFELINPHIEGTFKTEVTATSAIKAAGTFWEGLSELIVNDVPRFYFSIEHKENGKIVHYTVSEKPKGKKVAFELKEFKLESGADLDEFKKDLVVAKQEGGKKKKNKDDDSDSFDLDESEDEDELYSRIKHQKYINSRPIVYWWYDPMIYKIKTFFFPTFMVPISPYIKINLSSAFFY